MTMRKRYHIRIKEGREKKLKETLKLLACEPTYQQSVVLGGAVTYEFYVELSKYELLFLRLAVDSGEFVKVAK